LRTESKKYFVFKNEREQWLEIEEQVQEETEKSLNDEKEERKKETYY